MQSGMITSQSTCDRRFQQLATALIVTATVLFHFFELKEIVLLALFSLKGREGGGQVDDV